MKLKSLLLLLGLTSAFATNAQTITSITYSPLNPSSTDSITFLIQCDFPYTACEGTGYYNGVSGNQISAGGLHCMGSFAALCTDHDTIVVPPQPDGAYSFIFVLVTGQQPLCVPGILPLAVDSVNFTVSGTSGIGKIQERISVISPNPSEGSFSITLKDEQFSGSLLKIFSPLGTLLKSVEMNSNRVNLNTELAAGSYFLTVEKNNVVLDIQRFVIISDK